MPCFGRTPKFKSWFNKKKETSSYAERKKLLERQRKAQKKIYETLRKQQIKREKQLCSLKKAAGCPPPPAGNPSPCNSSSTTSPPQIQNKCMKTLRNIQHRRVKILGSLKKVDSHLTPPPRNPSPCNSSRCTFPPQVEKESKKKVRNLQRSRVKPQISLKNVSSCRTPPAQNPSSCKSSPSNPSRYPCDPPTSFPPPSPVSCESSSSCSCSDQEQCLARAISKRPQVTCLSSSGPLKGKCHWPVSGEPHVARCRSPAVLAKPKKLKKKRKKKLRGRKMRGEPRNLCCRCIICCVLVGTIVACAGFSIPILAGIIPPPSLSTCAQCDFVLEPPKLSATKLQRQTPCLGLDKLIQEERDNQQWNVAFQKALVKRLEASERRITLDDYLDDDDDGDRPGKRRKKKTKKEAETTTEKPKVKIKKVAAKLPEPEEVFKEKKCPCSSKVRSEERKRKTFVKIMEREQIRFEKRSLRAQQKYERDRQKAYKKCEYTQLAMEKGYFKRNKDGVVDKAEETFSVFIHMDPAQCACKGKAARAVKCKKCFFRCCVWLYIFGFIIFFVTTYFLTKL